jgi:TRAP-type C4-dicarboxylate transport system substrate-binding protein
MRRKCLLLAIGAVVMMIIYPNIVPAQEKPITFSYWAWVSSVSGQGQFLVNINKELEKKSNGRVKFTMHWAGSMGKPEEHLNLVEGGILDSSLFLPTYSPGRFPLISFIELPFMLSGPSGRNANKLNWALYKKGLFDKELYEKFKVLFFGTTNFYHAFTSKKKIQKMEDFNGLKMRAPGGVLLKSIKDLGCSPVSVPGGEFFTAVEKGIVDGGIVSTPTAVDYRLPEVIKYATILNLGVIPYGMVVRKESFNKLPKDVQKAWDDFADEALEIQIKGWDNLEEEAFKTVFGKYGVERNTLPPEEMKRCHEIANSTWDKWLADMKAKGLGSQTEAIIKEARSMAKSFGEKPWW